MTDPKKVKVMIDIIIPLCRISHQNYTELRFALRSVEKYLSGIGNVYLIGEKPKWIKNIVHLPFKDKPCSENKEWNILGKLQHACKEAPVSDKFMHMHDDHFILQAFEAKRFPVHHKGLMNIEARPQSDSYRKTLENTINLFPGTLNYNVHSPILYNKEKFLSLNLPYKPYGYALKTAYCNSFGITGEYLEDCKISTPLKAEQIKSLLKERPYFSVGNGAFNGEIVKVLQELYPLKSKYEC